jgi:hypothetical protein
VAGKVLLFSADISVFSRFVPGLCKCVNVCVVAQISNEAFAQVLQVFSGNTCNSQLHTMLAVGWSLKYDLTQIRMAPKTSMTMVPSTSVYWCDNVMTPDLRPKCNYKVVNSGDLNISSRNDFSDVVCVR